MAPELLPVKIHGRYGHLFVITGYKVINGIIHHCTFYE